MFGWIVGVAQFLWDGIQVAADAAVIALTYAYKALKLFGGAVWDVAKFTWNDVLKPLGQFVDRVYKHVRDFLERVYAPIHKWLGRISSTLRKIYTHYFRPILSLVDGSRRVLELLALLHVVWAAKLDHELMLLEKKISDPIIKAIQVINSIDSRIAAFILTADNLFKRVTLLGSIKRDVNAIANIQWNASIKALGPGHETWLHGQSGYAAADVHLDTLDAVYNGDVATSGVDADRALDVMEALAAGAALDNAA